MNQCCSDEVREEVERDKFPRIHSSLIRIFLQLFCSLLLPARWDTPTDFADTCHDSLSHSVKGGRFFNHSHNSMDISHIWLRNHQSGQSKLPSACCQFLSQQRDRRRVCGCDRQSFAQEELVICLQI